MPLPGKPGSSHDLPSVLEHLVGEIHVVKLTRGRLMACFLPGQSRLKLGGACPSSRRAFLVGVHTPRPPTRPVRSA